MAPPTGDEPFLKDGKLLGILQFLTPWLHGVYCHGNC